ncbi:Aspartyl protease family protein 2 [Dichanthelium oligosanthes]|uniref:Aspartyl protease family protein 2 n=1 Tax=Dichanthelium oligosanthes TaxID=888268 RepID=A0A1E5W5C1_9POAL|nr:Aspartyl protease family protein 2 [Dichanthelium oligosanthes]
MAALPSLLLPLLLLLLFSFSADATHTPRTLHVPVLHRDAVFPPAHTADAARYTAQLASLSSTTDSDDQLRSPVISGLPFDSGEYFAIVGVGDPSTRALVVIDTGSDLIWLQCAPCRHCYRQLTPLYDPRSSTTYRQIPCASPRCRGVLRYPGCDAGTGSCVYMVVYGDGSASSGNLATDRLVFPEDTHAHNVTLGCGHDNGGLFESAAGLLGVGRGELSFPTQVAATYGRVFSYCLGDRMSRAKSSSSYLVFGRTPELPSTAFTPLRTNPRRPSLYYVDMVGFSVADERVTGFSEASLALDPATGRGGIVVDSGTAISRFARDAYVAVRDAFNSRAAAGGMRKVAHNFSVFDACYGLRRKETVRVPSIVLHFAGGADMALPPANYLVPVQGGDRRMYFCLGLQAADDGLNVLGNVQQQGFGVVFDVERERIGFAPNGCST